MLHIQKAVFHSQTQICGIFLPQLFAPPSPKFVTLS
nr:MAG TPA: hypothetical protein [Caudoviricetes sp.]